MSEITLSLGFRVILGLYWDSGKENRNYYILIGHIRGYNGIIEKKMEKKMETTIF